MNVIILESVPAGKFKEISIEHLELKPPADAGSKPVGWGEDIVRLVRQGTPLKYNVCNLPVVPTNVAAALDEQRYVHGVMGDEHFLIPQRLASRVILPTSATHNATDSS